MDQKNLFLAILASLAILLSFQFFFPSERQDFSSTGIRTTRFD